jgi:hypothetical protein
MDINLKGTADYQALVENGLRLSEEEFKTIIGEVERGVSEARNYLKADDEDIPQITFLNDTGVMGFYTKSDSINIRPDYLNLVAHNETPLLYKDQLICFVPDKFYMVFKYLDWMRLFGIEETVHYYQRHGNPSLLVKFPESFPENMSPKSLLLSDLETEARNTVDKILDANNGQPVWKNLDKYFSDNYSDYYNKPIEELTDLPKSDLPISFEMENLLE